MTATAVKTKKTKQAPFQGQSKPGRALRSSHVSDPLPFPTASGQERLSDWDHAS